MKKAIALIPFLARRRRRTNAERNAKIGGPALLGIGAAATAFLIRRRKRSAAGLDVSPEDLRKTDGPRADAVRSDADPATGAAAESKTATTDTLGASAAAAGAAPAGSDAVTPDTGADDPLVREQTNAAAAEAGAIGGPVPAPSPDDPGVG